MGYETIREAIEDVEKQLDLFIKSAPKTYKELAAAIGRCLEYENEYEATISENTLELLVNAFIKHKK